MTKRISIKYWKEVKIRDYNYHHYMTHYQKGTNGVDYDGKTLRVLIIL